MEGNRKILVAVGVALLGVGAVLLKGDVPPNFLQLLSVIFGGFIVGNVGEHISGVFTPSAPAAVETPVPAPVAAPVEEVKVEDLAPIVEVSKENTVEQELVKLQALVQTNLDGTKANSDAIAIVQQALSLIINKYGIAE